MKDLAFLFKKGSNTDAVSKVHRAISFGGLVAMVSKPQRIKHYCKTNVVKEKRRKR